MQDEMVERLDKEIGAAERDGHETSDEPAQSGAKVEGGEALEDAQINFAAAINAVEQRRQPAVEPQKRVAANEILRISQVGQLEAIAGQGVAQIAEGQKAVGEDAVE